MHEPPPGHVDFLADRALARRRSVLLLEPYLAGSHEAWARGYRDASLHDVRLIGLPGRFWKWRMHGAAVTLARAIESSQIRPDLVLATDMLDLAAFLGLARRVLAGAAVALYMHENQLGYPRPRPDPGWSTSRRRRAERTDAHYPFVNLTSALCADLVLWNSAHNRDSFLHALPRFLRSFPDHREQAVVEEIATRSVVLPVGMDLASLDGPRADRPPGAPARVVWNHRWEHDKAPEVFFAALDCLIEMGLPFEVVLLGESFSIVPGVFDQARRRLGPRLLHCGFVPNRTEYGRWLRSADVVVSTARHEFFGTAVCEAVYCGARPVLPRSLAYPELVPANLHDLVLYDGFDDLVARLAHALGRPRDEVVPALKERIGAFDWRRIAGRYDRILGDLAREAALAPAASLGRLRS